MQERMQEHNLDNKLEHPSWGGAAELARSQIEEHMKAIEDLKKDVQLEIKPHKVRIRSIRASLRFFERKIKAGEPWPGNWEKKPSEG